MTESSTETEDSGDRQADRPSADAVPGNRISQSPATSAARAKSRPVRRVPKPRLTGRLDSPVHNLVLGVAYTVSVMICATTAYIANGWSFRDAFYMVVVTVFTVGYEEVRPIDTVALNVVTIGLIILGCTGVIFLTGALVQFFTFNQLHKAAGEKRMKTQIDQLEGHVIVCGFGRLGNVLARALSASSAGFVVLEENETSAAEAQALGYLCIQGDATSETALHASGVTRAHALASVLSNDALNVFITLTARALNPNLLIIARGELPSTEDKLLRAGADRVVMPTHIGAERIAELLLYQESARLLESVERSSGFQRVLHNFGVELEVITAAPNSMSVNMNVGVIERHSKGAFFIVQINRRDGDVFMAPPSTAVVHEGDGVVLIGRPNRSAVLTSLFEPRVRTGARG
jgi:voltage-gated potassium channel